MPVGPPAAGGAADLHGGGAAGGRYDFVVLEAPFGLGAEAEAHGSPGGAVAGFGGEGVGDLVQDRVAHFGLVVEEHQRAREADAASREVAAAEAAAGVVERERPAD